MAGGRKGGLGLTLSTMGSSTSLASSSPGQLTWGPDQNKKALSSLDRIHIILPDPDLVQNNYFLDFKKRLREEKDCKHRGFK
jgi:hypothetical protein